MDIIDSIQHWQCLQYEQWRGRASHYVQAQCSPVSTTITILTSVHYKHNAHQCPLQAQYTQASTTITILTSVHYKHNAHQCPLQAQCSPVSTTSTMLTSVHVFSESTLASNSALGMGPAVVSTALRREVQVGGIPLHRPLCQICNAFSPPIFSCIKDSTSTKRTPRLMGSSHFGTSFQTASNPISDGVWSVGMKRTSREHEKTTSRHLEYH